MKLPWVIAIATAGVAIYIVNKNANMQRAGTGVDDAASQTGAWGTKQRVKGTGSGLLGQVKQGVGKVTGDKQMQGDGMLDEAAGNIKNAAGKAADAVSDTLHGLDKS